MIPPSCRQIVDVLAPHAPVEHPRVPYRDWRDETGSPCQTRNARVWGEQTKKYMEVTEWDEAGKVAPAGAFVGRDP